MNAFGCLWKGFFGIMPNISSLLLKSLSKGRRLKGEVPRISVVIPTLDRYEILKQSLPSILKHGFNEVIVVDSSGPNQRYKNEKLCRRLGAKYYYKEANLQEAKNFGAEKAKGEWLIFRDDDVMLIDAGLETLQEKMASEDCDFIQGTAKSVWIFRRGFFLKIGGYDTKLCLYEDADIASRAKKYGKACKLSKSPGKTRELVKSVKMHWRQDFFYGLSFPNFFKKYPSVRSALVIPDYMAGLLRVFLQTRNGYSLLMFLLSTLGFLFSTLYFVDSRLFYKSFYPLSRQRF